MYNFQVMIFLSSFFLPLLHTFSIFIIFLIQKNKNVLWENDLHFPQIKLDHKLLQKIYVGLIIFFIYNEYKGYPSFREAAKYQLLDLQQSRK